MSKSRELRLKKGLSIIDLSHKLDIHPSMISQLERGRTSAGAKVRKTLCSFYRVPEGKLFNSNGFAI